MKNTIEMVVFIRVLGEDVKGAFLKECEAAYLRFQHELLTRFARGVGMGERDIVARKILT